jgi:hypothetical protein|tara:strand:- start:403 stop:504 length:102 start_codon:yes stop_codon:yes gene_type:complete
MSFEALKLKKDAGKYLKKHITLLLNANTGGWNE